MGLTLTSLPYQLSRPHRPGICMPLSFFPSFFLIYIIFLPFSQKFMPQLHWHCTFCYSRTTNEEVKPHFVTNTVC